MTFNLTDPAPVPDEELDQMIWKLERDGMNPKLLSLMRELREVRRVNAEKLNQPVSEAESLPLDYLQGHQDGLEWAAQMAEANHPQTGDWLYDDPVALAAAIRKGPDLSLASGNPPEIPDGYVMVPMRLMAENGAKGALSGEFSETKFINCPECFGDDECETCDGSGRIKITTPVSWTTIKAIWSKGVEHFAIAAPQEVG